MQQTMVIRTKTPEDKQKVIRAIQDKDSSSILDPEGNPVTLWIGTSLDMMTILDIEGVEDAVSSDALCYCRSGKERYPLSDARGIFCGYVCEDCEEEKRAMFRPEIFTDGNYIADEQIEEDY